ncbi:MAG: hypothetical protein AAF202_09725, partial [Pseudomonadota bacterium]
QAQISSGLYFKMDPEADVSDDGSRVLLRIKAETEAKSAVAAGHTVSEEFDHDILIYWDLSEEESLPRLFASHMFDNSQDLEPSIHSFDPANVMYDDGRIDDRQFAARMLADGKVVMARATVQEQGVSHENNQIRVFVKAVVIDGSDTKVFQFEAGPFDDLSLPGENAKTDVRFTGISNLEIFENSQGPYLSIEPSGQGTYLFLLDDPSAEN